ncbi:unnamed protein product [Brachionus calyciflorus]|uniref:G-protein coupled receptors family 1 profile domain-containing protein n=1 Tax=Brachionus calyciflorus TaxID=104777 RepID=A0A814DHL9_9BILA|nr:unnamed protein product [Brachionus calyciflorus]
MNFQNITNLSLVTNELKIEEFIYSFLSSIGGLTSCINIIMFWNLKSLDKTYKFYLISSLVDLFYSFIVAFYSLYSCGSLCDSLNSNSLSKSIYMLVLDDYFTSCLAICNIFIELYLSTQRYLLIKKRKLVEKFKTCVIISAIFTISLIYYSPILFIKKIIKTKDDGYETIRTKFGETNLGSTIPIILSCIRLILASFILLIINILTLFYFTKYMKKKIQINGFESNLSGNQMETNSNVRPKEQRENKARKNVTLMVISIAFTYSFGTIPYAMYYGLSELLNTHNFFIDEVLSRIGRTGLRLLVIFKIVIFFNFNRIYHQSFKQALKKIFRIA